ncbi:hypothetical protein A2311_05700 [candidate division WOR-1 bacterium RIFOXYB2_FULL_48_7]|uniref:Beta-ketoacyl synthase-like N-terminal domain-containing protein n=1 Tax=candidate division WOR-1 bacterium RIFOXYB2_FULL_48_7 TaxID=1802583 RepID=A0A1F4TL81_UNCSA|nr:MAG: hypothetical protein A2311_05700 [candidate division WOR-1 bacterium RIFOXYB2_FULL_48_7]
MLHWSLKDSTTKNFRILGRGRAEPGQLPAESAPAWRKMDRLSQMALVAAGEAINSSHLSLDLSAAAIVMATSMGAARATMHYLAEIKQYGGHLASALTFPNTVNSLVAGRISQEWKISGPSITLIGDLAGAVEVAVSMLRQKKVKYALVGFVDDANGLITEISTWDGAEVYLLAATGSLPV